MGAPPPYRSGEGIRGTNIELFCLFFYWHPSWLKLSGPSHSTGTYTPSILIPVCTLMLFVKSRVLIWNDGVVMQTTIMPCSSTLINDRSLINLVKQTLISHLHSCPAVACHETHWVGIVKLPSVNYSVMWSTDILHNSDLKLKWGQKF